MDAGNNSSIFHKIFQQNKTLIGFFHFHLEQFQAVPEQGIVIAKQFYNKSFYIFQTPRSILRFECQLEEAINQSLNMNALTFYRNVAFSKSNIGK